MDRTLEENVMNIAIWGAGKFGTYVCERLKEKRHTIIFIDNNAENINSVMGTKVVSPAEYMKCYKSNIDVLLVAVLEWQEIWQKLCEMEIDNCGVVNSGVYYYQLNLAEDILKDTHIVWKSELENKKAFMKKLETNVVDYCNMNCRGCSHFSNIFQKGDTVGYESFKKDIQYLSNKVFISHFDLLGGEAFLSKQLGQYIECLRQYMPKTSISVVSNGLLIPKQSEELLAYIKEKDVLVSITEYPPTAKRKDKIIGTLEKFGIWYEFRGHVETFGKNIDLSGKNDPYRAQRECREFRCHFLRNGIIYKCPFSALGNHFFTRYEIPLHFEEGVDIYDDKTDLHKALQALDTDPIEQCRYCGREERFSWEVSMQPESSEWLIDG